MLVRFFSDPVFESAFPHSFCHRDFKSYYKRVIRHEPNQQATRWIKILNYQCGIYIWVCYIVMHRNSTVLFCAKIMYFGKRAFNRAHSHEDFHMGWFNFHAVAHRMWADTVKSHDQPDNTHFIPVHPFTKPLILCRVKGGWSLSHCLRHRRGIIL